MQKTYKYRMYPSKAQGKAIDETIEKCRQLYNELLALKKDAFKQKGVNLCRKDLYGQAKGIEGIHSQVAQNVADRIDKAFKNFFRRANQNGRKKGFPRFKKYGVYRSITFPQIIRPEHIGKKVRFSKIGWINTKYHREIEGTPKTMTIKKAKSGKYFLTVYCDNVSSELVRASDKEVGIDLGLNHFIATSDGGFFEHPKPLKKLSKKRKTLARCFSKTKKKGKNREKARTRLARMDEKIVNVRNDFGWKLSNLLIKKYEAIYVESLDVKGMQENHYLAGAISDVSWSDFLRKLSFKAESAGRQVLRVDPRNTSQVCSKCNEEVKKSLSVRIHKCPYCGLEMDRDVNAACNILKRATAGQAGSYACGDSRWRVNESRTIRHEIGAGSPCF